MRSEIYEVTISHARSAPLRNVFRYRSYLWLVDLDHLPRVPWLARFRARDHLGDPRASIRANLDRFLAARGVRLYLRGLPVIPRPAHQSQEGVQ